MSKNKLAEEKYDTMSLNAIYFDRRSPYEKQIPSSVKVHSMWYYVWRILYACIIEIAKIIIRVPFRQWFAGWNYYQKIYDGTILFVLPSLNNFRSLERIIKRVKDSRDNVVVNGNAYYKSLPRLYVLYYSIRNIPKLLRQIKDLPPADRRIVGHYNYLFFITSGYTYCYMRLLSKYKPECVVMSNDHIGYCRALILICEDLGIKTIYVQHASVSYAFPELHFSFSFLDGIDALEKYTAEGKKVCGEAILLGAVRYDRLGEYRLSRHQHPRHCIGIAINKLDDDRKVNEFCNQLLEAFGDLKIKIRSHPSMKKNPLVFDNKERICYTCATDESIIDFLDSIDILVAGDSGVHLDAILGGVPTIAYNFSSLPYSDNYKYVEHGLINLTGNINELLTMVGKKHSEFPHMSLVRLYDESFGKSYAGKCSEIIGDFIINGYVINTDMFGNRSLNNNSYWISVDE